MKRYGKLFDNIISKENLLLAFKRAKKGKSKRKNIRKVEANLDKLIDKLHTQLSNGTYRTSEYKTKTIYEPKERLIYILPFYPDRIVHHAIMNVLEPIWDNSMYYHSYSCRKGKGMHKGSTLCMEYVRRYKYVLKCDISKFYPSINHCILKQVIRRKIKDKKLLIMLDEIIDSADGETNVPIGNYISQWLGNMYLNELDDLVKHKFHCKAYIRYCDDFVLFSNDKQELKEWALEIGNFINNQLRLKFSKCDIFPVSQGIDFLGYRHFPHKILCRKRTVKSAKKHVKEVMHLLTKNIINKQQALSKLASTEGWLQHAQCHNLLVSLNITSIKKEVEQFA